MFEGLLHLLSGRQGFDQPHAHGVAVLAGGGRLLEQFHRLVPHPQCRHGSRQAHRPLRLARRQQIQPRQRPAEELHQTLAPRRARPADGFECAAGGGLIHRGEPAQNNSPLRALLRSEALGDPPGTGQAVLRQRGQTDRLHGRGQVAPQRRGPTRRAQAQRGSAAERPPQFLPRRDEGEEGFDGLPQAAFPQPAPGLAPREGSLQASVARSLAGMGDKDGLLACQVEIELPEDFRERAQRPPQRLWGNPAGRQVQSEHAARRHLSAKVPQRLHAEHPQRAPNPR